MEGLDRWILNRCRPKLRECSALNSSDALSVLFNLEELRPYNLQYDRLSNNTKEMPILDYLENVFFVQHKGKEGRFAFLYFLRSLIDRHIYDNNELRTSLSIYHAMFEINQVILQEKCSNRYNPLTIQNLVAYFHHHPYSDKFDSIQQQLPATIIEHVRQREPEPDFDLPPIVRILTACFYASHGVGELAYVLYEETEDWRKLDRLVCDLDEIKISYAMLRRLQEKLATIHWPQEVLIGAYETSRPDTYPDDDDDPSLETMLDTLGKFPQRADKTLPLLQFAAHLHGYASKQQGQAYQEAQSYIYQWIAERANELGVNAPQLVQTLSTRVQRPGDSPAPDPAAYLLINVEPQAKQKFSLQAWLMTAKNQPVENTWPYYSETLIDIQEVPTYINEIRLKYEDHWSDKLIVEIFLPKHLLDFPVEHWWIDEGESLGKLGLTYRLVVRSWRKARTNWKERWQSIMRFMHGSLADPQEAAFRIEDYFWICEEGHCQNRESFRTILMSKPRLFCLVIGFVPSSEASYTLIMNALLNVGIPIALWPTEATNGFEKCLKTLQAQFSLYYQWRNKLWELPDWVLHQRRDAQLNGGYHNSGSHQGHHLTLLWDDPDRLPPDKIAPPLASS